MGRLGPAVKPQDDMIPFPPQQSCFCVEWVYVLRASKFQDETLSAMDGAPRADQNIDPLNTETRRSKNSIAPSKQKQDVARTPKDKYTIQSGQTA
jgi:hypothetical protein